MEIRNRSGDRVGLNSARTRHEGGREREMGGERERENRGKGGDLHFLAGGTGSNVCPCWDWHTARWKRWSK
jgi:hypothetical protein